MGFCTWAPIPGLSFPNLADAMGETAWSVMGRTWYWKDDVHFNRLLYYAKVILGQPSFIAPDYLPDFIAGLAGRGQGLERDPVRLYQEGRLSRSGYRIFECLSDQGPLPTSVLRPMTGLNERALLELQRRFLICKVGVTGRSRGTYGYIWDLAERFWPDAFQDSRGTAPGAARTRIHARLHEFGLVAEQALEARLFLWRPLS